MAAAGRVSYHRGMRRSPLVNAALLPGLLLLVGCPGKEEERMPGIELGPGTTGTGTSGGDTGGEGGEPSSSGGSGTGGAGGVVSGTGGRESDTMLDALLSTTNGFTFRGDGRIFNPAAVDVPLVVVADAPGGETVSATVEVGDELSLDGVLESEATWVLVESADANWYSTWQQVNTRDSEDEVLYAVTASDIEDLAAVAPVSLFPAMAQVVLRVENTLGDGIEADAQIAGVGAVVYSLYPGFDVSGPSDSYGYVALLNVPASEEASFIDVTVTTADDTRVVPVRVQGGAVTAVVVTME